MILLITNTTDVTVDFIVRSLRTRGVPFYRLNTDYIGVDTQFCFDFRRHRYIVIDRSLNVEVDLSTVHSVYFRRPEIKVDSTWLSGVEKTFIHNEIVFFLEGLYKILDKAFWLNKVYDIRQAENKLYQLVVAEEVGLMVPCSLVTNIPEHAQEFYDGLGGQAIIKPIKSGLMATDQDGGNSVIFTSQVKLDSDNIERIAPCPTYMQELLVKKADIRVTVVGKEVFAACIHSQSQDESKVDWRKSSEPLEHSRIELPADVQEMCIRLMRRLALNFGALDFVLDAEGNYIFLEINPNGQWAWIENQLKYPISNAITDLLVEKSLA